MRTNKMDRVIFVVMIGALFAGILAEDRGMGCYSEKQVQRLQTLAFAISSEGSFCGPVQRFVADSKRDMKTCAPIHIDIEPLRIVVNDLCTSGTDLYIDLKRNEQCLGAHFQALTGCENMIPPAPNPDYSSVEELVQYVETYCRRVQETYRCVDDGIGKPCGEAAERLVKRMTGALSIYQEGVCNQFHQDYYGSAAGLVVNWSVLLGLLFVGLVREKLNVL